MGREAGPRAGPAPKPTISLIAAQSRSSRDASRSRGGHRGYFSADMLRHFLRLAEDAPASATRSSALTRSPLSARLMKHRPSRRAECADRGR